MLLQMLPSRRASVLTVRFVKDWDKFRAALIERTEPAKQRRERMSKARTILLVIATLLLVIVLVH
jgi:hypothetical protein